MSPDKSIAVVPVVVSLVISLGAFVLDLADGLQHSQCGNHVFDILDTPESDAAHWTELKQHLMADDVELSYFKPYEPKLAVRNRASLDDRRKRLRDEYVHIRLAIFYEKTFKAQYPEVSEREKFIKNFVYQVQLIFEQKEISAYIKYNLVVVSISETELEFNGSMLSNQVLKIFSTAKSPNADLNILFLYRDMFMIRQTLGMAYTGTFCRKQAPNYLVASVPSLSSPVVVAHEMAHSLNVLHDGTPDRPEARCPTNRFIMDSYAGPNKLQWSECTRDAMLNFLSSDEVYSCTFNQERVSSAKPYKVEFDFTNQDTRKKLPGEEVPLDDQCSLALGSVAQSMLIHEGLNGLGSYSTCQQLVCRVEDIVAFEMGPALSGSQCSLKWGSTGMGRCLNGVCIDRA